MSLPESPHQPTPPKPSNESPVRPEPEYVGAPTELADAQEVPEWVEFAAKALFFLPGALVTATTIPIVVFGTLFLCLVACGLALALV